ncbi:MAG: hypothetical protein IJ828_11105 [Treponema sp.]|nr:hypothetical protein [Treponema sp.]
MDVTFVEVPRQRNIRDENNQIKEGHTPEGKRNDPEGTGIQTGGERGDGKPMDDGWGRRNGAG